MSLMPSNPPPSNPLPAPPPRRIPLAALAVILLLALTLGLAVWNQAASLRVGRALHAAAERDAGAARVLSAMRDLETGERGFLLTGTEAYLDPYRAGVLQLDTDLQRLEAAGIADPQGLRALTESKRRYAEHAIEVRRRDGIGAVQLLLDDGQDKALMDAVRDRVSAVQSRARVRTAALEREERLRSPVLTALSLLCALLACAVLAALALRRRPGLP